MKAEYIAPTPAELDEIKHGNRETINRLYSVNYPFILTICKAYCRNAEIKNTLWEDMAQECYLYFDKFDFANGPAFIRKIRDICCYVFWGGERIYNQHRIKNKWNTEILTILDAPVKKDDKHNDENMTLGETIPADVDIIDEIDPPPDYSEIVYDIASKYLTPRQKAAFEYFYYTDITAEDVGQKLGLNINGAQSLKNRCLSSLRKHSEELRQELLLIGLQSSSLRQTATA